MLLMSMGVLLYILIAVLVFAWIPDIAGVQVGDIFMGNVTEVVSQREPGTVED